MDRAISYTDKSSLAIVLALVMNKQRSQTKHVEERRYDGGGAPPVR